MVTLGLYNRIFGEDTPSTRAKARRVMMVVYCVIIVGAAAMLFFVISTQGTLPIRTAIQAGIMFVIGIGGLLIMRKAGQEQVQA